ncbi:MAG: hypothetical protein R3A47_00145 [Polyangiales bacterium]
MKIRPNLDTNLEEEQVGFQLLRSLVDLKAEIDSTPAGSEKDTLMQELNRSESFLEFLIQIQEIFGISSAL